ncbi:MAG: pyruvate ferredoxin oxidoreductase, partial [Gammaproteobacteria bacterium]|nr:pyruvate ferredoxin oxidoreductase [Gammaproteobacteria bacterium]
DSMSARDAGWIQLFVEDNQQAVDVHIQAFKLAEELCLPVMVCMDGFILTHSYSQVDMPEQGQVDQFLPPFEPRQVLDPAAPLSMGAMVGPEAFTEVRFLAHHKQREALDLIPRHAAEFQSIMGRDSGGLIKEFDCAGAETVIVTMGSVIGTMKEVLAGMREDGHSIGALTIRSFRPFPSEALIEALKDAKRIIVFEKCLAVGMGGIVSMNVRMALQDFPLHVHSVIGGLGGRPITRKNLRRLFEKGLNDQLEETHFHDIDMEIVNRELEREKEQRQSGSIAENILHDVGVVAAAKTI